MNKEELERIADNIQKQMILEQNTGYRNEYSQTLKDKIDLYNEVIRLQERIDNATERLNTLIEFWKKYNPIDNTMQVEQFKGVINILGGKEC